jgi:hypothetical protein
VQVGQVTAVAWPGHVPLALTLAEDADRAYDWPGLGLRDPGPLRLIVVPDQARMRELSGGRAPSWGAGVALPGSRTILIRADARDPVQTLRHELAHLALRRAIRSRTPLWFDEGYAAFASGEWDRLDALALNLAVVRGAVPELGELDGALRGRAPSAEASYALAMSAVIELARRNPTGTLEPLIELLGRGLPFDEALQRTTGLNPGQFAVTWREGVRRRHGILTWLAAGGLWALIALSVLGAAWLRRRADRPRRRALDHGWVVIEDPPDDELDRSREAE